MQPTLNRVLKVNGNNVLVKEDTFIVSSANCPHQPPGDPTGPCMAVRFDGASVSPKLRINGLHVLLQDGSGGEVGVGVPGVAGAPAVIAIRRGTVTITPNDGPLKQM
jgi:hypothetical protein